MRDAGHMDTYDARYEATEKAEATVQEKFPRQSARSGKRRSWKLPLFRKDCCRGENGGNGSATILRRNEVQGRPRELTIRNGSAVLRTNGESFDATDILKDMRAHGVDIGRVSGKAMSEMLKVTRPLCPEHRETRCSLLSRDRRATA